MKSKLPLLLVGLSIVILVSAALIIFKSFKGSAGGSKSTPEPVRELSREEWPVFYLSPAVDGSIPNSLGHLLKLSVSGINVKNASSMDYLLVYNTESGGQQGVPGQVKLDGASVERNLLLGSESSGKYRFDAGVNQGSITLTFRDANGKSLGKISSDFHLQSGETELTSVDGKFTYTLDKPAKGVFFVTMPVAVKPTNDASYVVWKDGYGVFASDEKPHSGK